MGTIPRIVAHLDLDGARISPWAARRQDEEFQFVLQGGEALWQHARTGEPAGEPEDANEVERVPKADARGRHPGLVGDAGHREPDEVRTS